MLQCALQNIQDCNQIEKPSLMKRFFALRVFMLIILSLAGWSIPQAQQPDASASSSPRPAVANSQQQGDLTLERLFSTLGQGQVGLMRLTGPNISEARVLFQGSESPFMTAADGWYALVVVDIDAQPRLVPYSVVVRQNGATVAFDGTFDILSAGFGLQNFDVPTDLSYLIEPAIERDEYARLEAITATHTPQRLWSAEWQLPINAPYSSAFGQYRILSDNVLTRHTGWDQRAPIGTPIGSVGAGRVAYVGRLSIRGNYVMIDHGWGVYSGYAHLSQINVAPGQTVQSGQIIGISGNTGRSIGPHLHWEIAVNSKWIDGAFFIEQWLP